jgi:hypothetical protein
LAGDKVSSAAMAVRGGSPTASVVVHEAHVEEGIGVRCEGHPLLADHVLGLPVLVSNGVLDLGV